MIKVFSHEDRFLVQQVKDLLDQKEVACFIKNEFASGAIGELAPFDCCPEVWILDEEWEPKAKLWIAQLAAESGTQEWHCNSCGEDNDGSFELCWQCGHSPVIPS